ncbi:MAG: class I SAM-dependent methyltransferase [Patescibacteria group bacterium]|nr:class I SAM-dependent methyltransferase [Patescibacteria group bacterium]
MIFTGERTDFLDKGGINTFRYKCLRGKVKGKSVVELGCAYGYGTYLLSKFGAKEIVAYDNDKNSIAYANKHYKSKTIFYFQADVEKLDLGKERFDIAVSFEVIEHLRNPEKFLDIVSTGLKKKGLFFVSTPNRYMSSYDGDKPSNPYHVREYYPSEFKSLLLRNFKEVVLYGIVLKDYKKTQEEKVKETFRWKFASMIVRKRFMRRIINYFPAWPKRIITGENKVKFLAKDYKLAKDRIDQAPYLFAVCAKN